MDYFYYRAGLHSAATTLRNQVVTELNSAVNEISGAWQNIDHKDYGLTVGWAVSAFWTCWRGDAEASLAAAKQLAKLLDDSGGTYEAAENHNDRTVHGVETKESSR